MRYLSELVTEKEWQRITAYLKKNKPPIGPGGEKKKVNIFGLGDVGGTVLLGLKLMGGDVIDRIGIYDLKKSQMERYESEMNQIDYPFQFSTLPKVEILKKENLFDCDVFVFCASKEVPPLDSGVKDVRMAQYDANKEIIEGCAKTAKDEGFIGIFAVVSDPVDPLCAAVLNIGLRPLQVRGYGIGVMNTRAAYFAKREKKYESFLKEGRVFGPHGMDFVAANSIEHYSGEISKELTRKAVKANLKIRATGNKPYIAPAIASGAIPIILTLRGEWHYSSLYFGTLEKGAFFGLKNRITEDGLEVENIPIPDDLFAHIETAYNNLLQIE